MKSTFAIAAAIGLAVASVPAYALSGKLTIVTSYPTDTTATFEKAFEKKYPSIDVEMLKKRQQPALNIFRKQQIITRLICFGLLHLMPLKC